MAGLEGPARGRELRARDPEQLGDEVVGVDLLARAEVVDAHPHRRRLGDALDQLAALIGDARALPHPADAVGAGLIDLSVAP